MDITDLWFLNPTKLEESVAWAPGLPLEGMIPRHSYEWYQHYINDNKFKEKLLVDCGQNPTTGND